MGPGHEAASPWPAGGEDRDGLLAAIVVSSDDAIIGKTLDGTVISWNAGAERLYGYPAAEMIGQSIARLVPDGRPDELPAILARVAAGERVGQFETRRATRDGTVIDVSITVSPVRDAAGNVTGASSVARAVTAQARRDSAEGRLAALVESSDDAIVSWSLDGVCTSWNSGAERILGYSAAEMIGTDYLRLREAILPDKRPDEALGILERIRRDGPGGQVEVQRMHKDGRTVIDLLITISPVRDPSGTLVGTSVVSRDITARKAAERSAAEQARLIAESERDRFAAQAERDRMEIELHKSQRLESLGQMAGGVAHDFNNLLGVIMNYGVFVDKEAVRAARGDFSSDWAEVHDDVDQILRAAERGAALVQRLLVFARREVVRPEVLALNGVVAGLELLLQRAVGDGVEITLNLAPGLWPVLADRGQVEQLLVNLAVNARDAMPGGGTLTIETDNFTVDGAHVSATPGGQPGPHARLRVTDTGIGMSAELRARVFEPFFTTKPSGAGSGLGLATVYGIITQCGGHAEIISEPGRGTTFTVLLPATDQAAARREPREDRPPRPGHGETVLVVEDGQALRDVTARIAGRNGYQVLTAGDGPSALTLLKEHAGPVDLLLTDVMMPHMLGREVAQRAAKLRPGIRVLYMSGYAQRTLDLNGILDSGVSLIEKPFTDSALLDRIAEALDGS